MNQNLSEIQQVLLTTYKAFKKFCDDNGIKFFAAFGTMLGAVRHQGFIPWDDDIDVFMLRPYYQKFLSMKSEVSATSIYRIVDYHDKGYPYAFAKFYDSSKTILDYPQFPIVLGPYIDIFILDEAPDDPVDYDKFFDKHYAAFWDLRKSISHQTWREIWHNMKTGDIYNGIIKVIKKVYYAPQYSRLLRRVNHIENEKARIKGSTYCMYNFSKKNIYKKEWFDTVVDVEFEDTTIPIPSGYDAFLQKNYGDYMTPPPVSNRTGHNPYFTDLSRRLTYDEILNEKKPIKQHNHHLKLSTIFKELCHRKKL